MTQRKRSTGQAGVTLIEMLVVVTIIALFVGVVGIRMLRHADTARITAAHAQISNFKTALAAYKLEKGTFPTTEEGLAALRPYLEAELPKDPWGHDYIYKFPGEHGEEPDIISLGADGQTGGEGINADIVSWRNQ